MLTDTWSLGVRMPGVLTAVPRKLGSAALLLGGVNRCCKTSVATLCSVFTCFRESQNPLRFFPLAKIGANRPFIKRKYHEVNFWEVGDTCILQILFIREMYRHSHEFLLTRLFSTSWKKELFLVIVPLTQPKALNIICNEWIGQSQLMYQTPTFQSVRIL